MLPAHRRTKAGTRATVALGGFFTATLAALAVVWTAHQEKVAPSVLTPSVQDESEVLSAWDVQLDPPPEGFASKITAEEAVDESRGYAGKATAFAPTLASFTNLTLTDHGSSGLLYDHVPAWLVEIEGACIGRRGPDSDGGCASRTEWVVINATSGEVLQAFG